jgi:hypothetical protein
VGEVLVESLIVLILELGFRPRPESLGLIDRIFRLAGLENDGYAQVIRILAHQSAKPRRLQEFLVFVAKVHDDFGAPIGLVGRLDLVRPLAVRIPAHAFGVRSLAQDGDAVGDDERGIEADAELADELGVLGGIAAQPLEEFLGARTGDGPQVVDDLRLGHADAVVLDGQRAGFLVRDERHRQLIRAHEARVCERLEAELLAGIRGVRYQFTEKNLSVRVQRMDHQAQHLLGLGLELFDLRLCFGRHGLTMGFMGGSK